MDQVHTYLMSYNYIIKKIIPARTEVSASWEKHHVLEPTVHSQENWIHLQWWTFVLWHVSYKTATTSSCFWYLSPQGQQEHDNLSRQLLSLCHRAWLHYEWPYIVGNHSNNENPCVALPSSGQECQVHGDSGILTMTGGVPDGMHRMTWESTTILHKCGMHKLW